MVLAVLVWQYFTGYLGRPHLAYTSLPFFIGFMMINGSKKYKWLLLCFVATFIAFLADSRRTFIGVLMIWLMFLNDYFENLNKMKKIIVLTFVPVIFLLFAPDSLSQRIDQGFEGVKGLSEGLEFYEISSDAFTNRDKIWTIGYTMWLDNMIFGVGTMNARGLMDVYSDFYREFSVYRMHNAYLRILVEQGIIGLIIFFIIVFILISYAFKANNILKLSQDILIYWFNKIILYKIVSILVLWFFGGWAIYDKLFWMDIAITIVIYDYAQNLKNPTS
tara:strand:- start:246 stop:1073 length:828 start_codon:yes stop_codon:yes gene_type:complete